MGAARTQISLTKDQLAKLDARRKREHKTLAQVVREAIDAYVRPEDKEPKLSPKDFKKVLDETFGSIPDLKVPPRSEWERRARRIGY